MLTSMMKDIYYHMDDHACEGVIYCKDIKVDPGDTHLAVLYVKDIVVGINVKDDMEQFDLSEDDRVYVGGVLHVQKVMVHSDPVQAKADRLLHEVAND
ncbi:hypothetical protein [Yersinia phage MHG19]|nr:hypothetical protein [Yersinia phage MHG19]